MDSVLDQFAPESPDDQLRRLIAQYSVPQAPSAPPAAPVDSGTMSGTMIAKVGDSGPRPIPAPTIGLPSTIPGNSSATATRQAAEEKELNRLQTTGSGVEQYQHRHPILGTIARVGDAALSSVFPTIAMNIPGTSLHHQQLVNQEQENIAGDVGNQEKEAQTANQNSEAQARLNPIPKVGLTPEEATLHDLMSGGPNGTPRTNPKSNKPYSYIEAYQATKQAAQDTKPEKADPPNTERTVRIVKGVPHEILIDKTDGHDIRDLGQTKIPGEAPADKRAANEQAQVEREARTSIRKAEGQYHDTQKSVAQLKASIDASKDGNGLLTSFVPTMEVLGINAANGVHRISPVEAQAANLPGGWAEQFNAWFDKASTGKLSPELQQEGKQLAGILSKTAHDRYKQTYEDESGIVSGYGGKDFGKRVPMLPEEAADANSSTPKIATQQHIADYAKQKGISTEQAAQEFTQSGYRIQ